MFYLAALVLIVCLLFFLFGRSVVNRLPTISQLNLIRKHLQTIALDRSKLGKCIELSPLCRRELHELATTAAPLTIASHDLRNMTFGQIVHIVALSRENLDHSIRELRLYAFLVLLCASVGVGRILWEYKFQISWGALQSHVNAQPFSVLSLFEMAVIAFFALRLALIVKEIHWTLHEH